MTHPENGPITIIASLLALVALPAQIRARSIPTISLSLWLFVTALTRGINAAIWTDNVDIKLKVWCDITTKIAVGFPFSVPGAALCIMRQLEAIASTRSVGTSAEQKRRRLIFEAVVCWIIPLIFMVVHYTVQGHRYDLIEGMGCMPTYYNSVPTLILMFLPPVLYSFVSLIYGIMVVRHFVGHRLRFMTYLKTCTSSISLSRYIRLLCLASIEVFWELGASIYILYYDISLGLEPYDSWASVHLDFSRINRMPRFLVPDGVYASILFAWWIPAVASICFFVFFGTGEEAMKDYRKVIRLIRVKIFRQTVIDKDSRSQLGSLPTYSTSSRGVTASVTQMYGDKVGKGGRKPWEDIDIKLPDLGEPTSPTDYASSLAPSYKANSEAITVSITPVSDTDASSSVASSPVNAQPTQPPPARLAPSRFTSAGANGVRVTIEKESDMV